MVDFSYNLIEKLQHWCCRSFSRDKEGMGKPYPARRANGYTSHSLSFRRNNSANRRQRVTKTSYDKLAAISFSVTCLFFAWRGEADVAERLLTEWGWVTDRRELADSEALARFLAFAPEPGNDQETEHAMMSHWNGWRLLVLYFSFGSLRETDRDYPASIIEWTVPAGSDLTHLHDAPDFHLDLMLDQQHSYSVYARDGAIWLDEMQDQLQWSKKTEGRLTMQGGQWAVEWELDEGNFPGYGFQNSLLFSSNLGQNLEQLGLPIQQWQNRDPDIVNEALEIVRRPR